MAAYSAPTCNSGLKSRAVITKIDNSSCELGIIEQLCVFETWQSVALLAWVFQQIKNIVTVWLDRWVLLQQLSFWLCNGLNAAKNSFLKFAQLVNCCCLFCALSNVWMYLLMWANSGRVCMISTHCGYYYLLLLLCIFEP